jgi:3-methyladenine DNA glycosylase/8-oxoguanine DNA glycosylase
VNTTSCISTPEDFDFWRTAYSHGWCDLLPYTFDADRQRLMRVLQLHDGTLVHCTMRASSRGIRVDCAGPAALTPLHRTHIRNQLRSCFRLDEDFSEFHATMRCHSRYRWIARRKAGRLLRAPTVFEDAVKMICTTNCAWHLTVVMVRRLTGKFGRSAHGLTAFPAAEAIAASSERELRRDCSTGYRSRALIELAERVASGALPIEKWRHSPLSTPDLYDQLCGIRGIGPYAAGNILRLLGRYEHLGLDSWVRKQWSKLHAGGRAVKDSRIEAYYRPLGSWRGLVFWLEMTRDWHE